MKKNFLTHEFIFGKRGRKEHLQNKLFYTLSKVSETQDPKEGYIEMKKKHIKDIENALKKIENGTYGYCDYVNKYGKVCGELIEQQRLLVRPETPFCLACAKKNENQQKPA